MLRDKVAEILPTRASKFLRDAYNPLRTRLQDRESSEQLSYILANGVKTATQMVTSLWVARMVAPGDIGVWQGVAIIQSYLLILSLGVQMSVKREYTLYKGAGRDDLALDVAGVGLLSTLLWAIISVCVVFGLLVFMWTQGHSSKTLLALALFSIPAFSTPFIAYFESLYHGENRFGQLAKINLLSSLYLIMSVGFVYQGAWAGLFLRNATAPLIAAFLRRSWLRISLRLHWDRQIFSSLVRFGFKLIIVNYIYSLLLVADRTLIAANLGNEALGYYALALIAQTAIVVLPGSLNQVIYTRMNYRYGQTGQVGSLKRLAFLPVFYNAVLLIIPAIILMALVSPVVTWILPNYVAGIPAARWTILAGYFMMLWSSASIFSTRNRMLPYGLVLFAGLVCMYILGWIAIHYFGTIESVAIAKVITMAGLALGVNILVYYHIKNAEVAA